MVITMRCPVCKLTVSVRARQAAITCPHPNTVHDAKKPALMTMIATDQKVPA